MLDLSMPLPAQLPIIPFTLPVHGEVTLPGSKSLTNRALLLAALCDEPVTLTGTLFSEDTRLMIAALQALGLEVIADEKALTLKVGNQTNSFQSTGPVDLFVGLAGTAARFLTALCAAAPRGIYRIDGVPQMRKRPMKGLIDALRSLGADIRCIEAEGFFPIEIHACGLRGGEVSIDASESSQMLSALLMVAPLAATKMQVLPLAGVRWPFVDMTKNLIAEFGPDIGKHATDNLIVIEPGKYKSPGRYEIEPDATAASYYLTLPIVTGGDLRINGLGDGGLQGDTAYTKVLMKVVPEHHDHTYASKFIKVVDIDYGVTEVSFEKSFRRIGVFADFREFSDTFLTLAAIAPLLNGPTKITGIAHSRKQETDRVAGMARELIKLGQHVIETEDSLEIHPRPLKSGVVIETYHDHRFAMSFGILGCHDLLGNGQPWLTIDNPGCCAKTFPNFFELLDSLRPKPSHP